MKYFDVYPLCTYSKMSEINHLLLRNQQRFSTKKYRNPCTYQPKYEQILNIACHSQAIAFKQPINHSGSGSTKSVYSSIIIVSEVSLLIVKMQNKYWKIRIKITVRSRIRSQNTIDYIEFVF